MIKSITVMSWVMDDESTTNDSYIDEGVLMESKGIIQVLLKQIVDATDGYR